MSIEEEKTAAMRYIRTALKRGYSVAVWEGGDYAHEGKLTKPHEIRAALASTDMDTVEVWKPSECADDKWTRLGNFLFVWGNSPEEVLSDYSAYPAMDAIVNEAEGRA